MKRAGFLPWRESRPNCGKQLVRLEIQLESQLNVARVPCIRKLSKSTQVACGNTQLLTRVCRRDACVRVRELSVIEDVEAFKPKLRANGLAHLEVLEDGEVPLVDSGSA